MESQRKSEGEKQTNAYVFIGDRDGATIKGELIAVPKGKRKASGSLTLNVRENGTLSGESDFRYFKDVFLRPLRATGEADAGSPSGETTVANLPDLPSWIELSENPYLIVDFGSPSDGQPRITLPVDFLPDYLPTKDGTPVIPDNFCGLNVRKADAFFWQTRINEVVNGFPYNSAEDVYKLGDDAFLGGIEFTGPIGQCADENEPWQFFYPLTQTGESPTPDLKLIIQMRSESEIRFLNFNVRAGEPLEAYELFSEETLETMKRIAEEVMKSLEIDNGYCSIDSYVKKVCEETPSACPVSNDFESPCP